MAKWLKPALAPMAALAGAGVCGLVCGLLGVPSLPTSVAAAVVAIGIFVWMRL